MAALRSVVVDDVDAVQQCCAAIPERRRCPRDAEAPALYCAEHRGPMADRPYNTPVDIVRLIEQWARPGGRTSRGTAHSEEPDDEQMWAIFSAALIPYRWYWRVDVHGVENIPTSGPALLVANHSGAVPIDGALLKIATLKEHGRNPWLLAGDLVFRLPVAGRFVRRMGNARADRSETTTLLDRGELVGVFPEGFKGIGKGWRNRYQLEPFGRGGFASIAVETGAPIIPVAIIGAEEMYPMIANIRPLARLLRLPYFPVTPTFPLFGPLGVLPIPSKCIIMFGEPIPTLPAPGDHRPDELRARVLAHEVRTTVQTMVWDGLSRRRTVLW